MTFSGKNHSLYYSQSQLYFFQAGVLFSLQLPFRSLLRVRLNKIHYFLVNQSSTPKNTRYANFFANLRTFWRSLLQAQEMRRHTKNDKYEICVCIGLPKMYILSVETSI